MAKTKKEVEKEYVIPGDSANYDLVVKEPRAFKLSDGRTVDFSDTKKFPLAKDHQRFEPITEDAA